MGKWERGTGEEERETDNGEQGTGNVSKDFEQNFVALCDKKSTGNQPMQLRAAKHGGHVANELLKTFNLTASVMVGIF